MTIFNKTCTFNVGNGALLMTKVTSLRLCLCQWLFGEHIPSELTSRESNPEIVARFRFPENVFPW